jgi:hypothetical protein
MANEHRGVRVWHVLPGVLAIGGVACAGILGIDDRHLDTSDGGKTDGGTQDGPGTGDGQSTGDGPTGDSPSGAETGTNDAGCTPTAPCVLATGLNHPFIMTSDAKNVYWTEFGDDLGSGNGSVKGCPIDGCGSGPTVYATALTNPRGIAVDANNVYFGTASYGSVVGAVWSCPIAGCGGSPTKLTAADSPFGIAVDSMYVYWADYDDSTVHRIPKAGGTNDVLYDGGGPVYVGQEVAYDTTSLYFTDENGNVYKLPIGGGSVSVMASWGALGGWPVRADSNWVYYGQPGGVSAMAKNATDGGPFIADNLQDPLGIALDPPTGRLYWADYGSGSGNDGTIGRVGTDGGGRLVVASSQVNLEDVTVSGNYVFWISSGTMNDDAGNALPSTGELLRMPK